MNPVQRGGEGGRYLFRQKRTYLSSGGGPVKKVGENLYQLGPSKKGWRTDQRLSRSERESRTDVAVRKGGARPVALPAL